MHERSYLMPREHQVRPGFTLMETMIAMTVGAVIVGLAIPALARFMDMQRTGRDHLQQQTTIGRLAEQFRGDVWAARHAAHKAGDPEDVLTLSAEDGRRTEYKIVGSVLYRTVFHGNDVSSRETFELPATPRLELDEGETESRATLTIALRNPLESSEGRNLVRPVRVSAAVARDHRFVPAEKAP